MYASCSSQSFHTERDLQRQPAGAGFWVIILERAAVANLLISDDTYWWRIAIRKCSPPQPTKVFFLMEPMVLRVLHFSVNSNSDDFYT